MKRYLNFLGIEKIKLKNNCNIIGTNNRDILLSGMFSYPIIITRIKDKTIISCSEKYKNEFEKYCRNKKVDNEKEICEILNEFATKNFKDFEIKIMYRMTKLISNEMIDCREVQLIDETKRDYFYNIVKKSKDKRYRELKWEEFKSEKAPFRN